MVYYKNDDLGVRFQYSSSFRRSEYYLYSAVYHYGYECNESKIINGAPGLLSSPRLIVVLTTALILQPLNISTRQRLFPLQTRMNINSRFDWLTAYLKTSMTPIMLRLVILPFPEFQLSVFVHVSRECL